MALAPAGKGGETDVMRAARLRRANKPPARHMET